MRTELKFVGVAFALFLSACSKQPVAADIEESVQANQNSSTLLEWETSALHPKNLILKWEKEQAESNEICDALLARTDDELALFEEPLESAKQGSQLSPCLNKLQDRIASYWGAQAEIMKASATKGRFQPKAIVRDLTNGYYVVDADLGPKQVMLTFDDGPHSILTDSILQSMDQYNAKATFFTLGRSVKAYPQVLKRVAAAGHSIGSHSINHPCLAQRSVCRSSNGGKLLSFAEATRQIVGGHQAVFNVLGWVDPVFRFPYGEASPELKKFLRDRSVAEFFWSIDSEDWKSKSSEKVVSDVMSQLNRAGRGVILFHDIQKRTAIAMPRLMERLFDGGYIPVIMKPKVPQPPGTNLLED